MSTVLKNRNPIPIIPELAVALGFNEAALLQQVHYWCEMNEKNGRNERDGHFWVYNSAEAWSKQIPWMSVRTVKTAIKNLEERGFLISGNFNTMAYDRTKWYRPNYEALEAAFPEDNSCTMESAEPAQCKVQELHNGECETCTMESAEPAPPIPETNPIEKLRRIHEERLKGIEGIGSQGALSPPAAIMHQIADTPKEQIDSISLSIASQSKQPETPDLSRFAVEHLPREISDFVFWYMYDGYPDYFGCEHPKLRAEHKVSAGNNIAAFARENGIESEDLKLMARDFFEDDKIRGDYSIILFSDPEILRIRYYNVIY